ncbi:MAG TPA: hypothetical protein VNX28_11415 [Gemmataceae bacterium]|jgi:hypothetical protein|nr:hypothetical protein [Gemmataceae bacterium]
MNRNRDFATFITKTAVTLLLVTVSCLDDVATSAPPPLSLADNQKDPAKDPPTDVEALAGQVKELQKQLAALQARVDETQSPRIIAAGTATFELGKVQNNATFVRVKLNADVTARLGADYIVLLTTRVPTGSFPLYVPYWKKAKDGFDVTLANVTLGPDGNVSYLFRTDKTFPIDWIVVKK